MYSDDFLFFSIHILYVLRNLKSKYDMDMMWSYVIKSVCIGGMCWSSMLWEYVMRPIIMYWICYEVIIYVLRIWVENRCHGNMYWENIMCFGYMCWNLYVLEVCFRTHRVCIERKGYVLGICVEFYMFWKYVLEYRGYVLRVWCICFGSMYP